MATGFSPVTTLNNGATFAAQVTPQVIWQKTVDRFEENADFYQSMEGGADTSVIMTKTDLGADRGQKLRIRVGSGYYDEPHYGDAAFVDETDFESEKLSEYDLTIDVIRHAVSYNERAGQLTGLGNEVSNGVPERLGDWLGRIKTENLEMLFRNRIPGENVLYPNGKTLATLGKADGLSWNFISTAGGFIGRMGGQRAKIGKEMGGNAAMRLSLIATSTALTVLRQDPDYKSVVINAGVRGLSNTIFKGNVTDIDGIAIVERNIIDHDGEGAIGSPQEPRARLGVAIAAGTATFDALGGGNATSAAITKKKYFKHFPDYAYMFADQTTVAATSGDKYFLVINPPNAVTDPNKIGMYSYSNAGNNGNKLVVNGRLGSAASGIRVTTLGGVTWNTGIWANIHTDVHPIGSTIIPCNRLGEPIGCSFLLARAAALRGYGKFRNRRGKETKEDDFLTQIFIRSYFGQSLRYDRQQRVPGVVTLWHSLHYPDLPLPVVV